MILGSAAALAGAAAPLRDLFGRSRGGNVGRFGPLIPDRNGIFDLPRGFSYAIVQRAGEIMSDGYVVPGSFDGMGCFPGPSGTLILMRNHENMWVPFSGPCRPGQPVPAEAYDPAAQGAVTRVVLDAGDLSVRSSNLVLAGTVRNCAGGVSPWGWLSCEETAEARHGYVFLCPTDRDHVQPPRRVQSYGRFRHEAACVDPSTLVAYLTEDQGDGCFYRMVPESPDRPLSGRLQALRVAGRARFDTSEAMRVGEELEVDWVDIAEVDPADDTVRSQGHRAGAALFRRGEGIWYERDQVHFSATTGGPKGAGQIFRLTVGRGGKPDRLLLLAQSTTTDELDMPDNLTVAPSGEVFLAEDTVRGDQYLRVVSREGKVSDFGHNAVSQSELAGLCFSPDGGTLFVNVYGDGLTLAIRGPFRT